MKLYVSAKYYIGLLITSFEAAFAEFIQHVVKN